MPSNPFMRIVRDNNGRRRVIGTDASTSRVEDILNGSPLLSDDEVEALFFQAERDDLPDFDPDDHE